MSEKILVELVGGPFDGEVGAFLAIPTEVLKAHIQEHDASDPMAGNLYQVPPKLLENRCLCAVDEDYKPVARYVFGIPWRTLDGKRLRAEYVPTPGNSELDDSDDSDVVG